MKSISKSLSVIFAGLLVGTADAQEPVVSEIVIEAPPAAIWSAWTAKEEVEVWMAPSVRIELEIGGDWLTSYEGNAALDDDSVVHNRILAFDPERMLALATVKPPADFPFPSAILNTWSVLYIDAIDDGKTKVTLRMFGFGDDQESEAMREFFEWGNQYELDNLKSYIDQKYREP